MKEMPEEAANELWKTLNKLKDKEKIVVELYDKLETGNDLFRAWLGYMNSHLSETEQLLVDKTKEFLGEDNESRRHS